MIATLMGNDLFLGGLCFALITVPILGIQFIHSKIPPNYHHDATAEQKELL